MKMSFRTLLATFLLVFATTTGCERSDPPDRPSNAPEPALLQVTNATSPGFIPPSPNNPNGGVIPPFTIVRLIYTEGDVNNPDSAYNKARACGTTLDQLQSSNGNDPFSGIPIEPGAVSATLPLPPGPTSVSLLVVGLNPNGVTDGVTYAEHSLIPHEGLTAITVTGTFGSPLSIAVQ
jgi:hypothetical protein